MSIVDQTYRTLTCNGKDCSKTVTYVHPTGLQDAIKENNWISTARIVQTGDGRNFFYHDDLCEISGIESGQHNVPEAPKVEIPQGSAQAQIAAAAAAAKHQEQANEALKKGNPIQLAQK